MANARATVFIQIKGQGFHGWPIFPGKTGSASCPERRWKRNVFNAFFANAVFNIRLYARFLRESEKHAWKIKKWEVLP
jgi:hypothetical protein